MKVRIFREAETVELQGHSLSEPVMQSPPEIGSFDETRPLICEHREYPIRLMIKARRGEVVERHNIVIADPLVNELLDTQSWEAAFWRDMVKGREKESKLLGDDLEDAREEAAHFKSQWRYYQVAAWGFLATSVGLLIVLGVMVFR